MFRHPNQYFHVVNPFSVLVTSIGDTISLQALRAFKNWLANCPGPELKAVSKLCVAHFHILARSCLHRQKHNWGPFRGSQRSTGTGRKAYDRGIKAFFGRSI